MEILIALGIILLVLTIGALTLRTPKSRKVEGVDSFPGPNSPKVLRNESPAFVSYLAANLTMVTGSMTLGKWVSNSEIQLRIARKSQEKAEEFLDKVRKTNPEVTITLIVE